MDNKTGNLVKFPGYVMGNAPDEVFAYFNDFTEYAVGDWTLSETSATGASALSVTTDGTDGGHGVLTILNDGAADDYTCLAGPEIVTLAAGKPCVFKCRIKLDDTGLAEWCFGLGNIATTDPLAAGAFYVDDWMGFVGGATESADGVIFRSVSDGTAAGDNESDTGAATMVDDTWVELSFHYDGNGTAVAYKDNVKMGSLTTNICADETLGIMMAVNNSSAVNRTMYVDYVGVWQLR